jgi:hypothetical protein
MKHSTLARAVAAALAAIAASQAPAGPQEDLSACGAIADPAERLACYDRLSGRSVAPAPSAPQPAAAVPKPPASPAPSSAGPPPAASPAAPTAAGPASPAAGAPAQAGTPAAKPAAPPPDAGTFGSYPTEHPAAAAVAKTLSAQVVALGKTIDGFPTVTLEGGALWLLDEKDPLLAIGDTVTLTRGVLGGFLLETPTRRLHHVRRIR